MSGSWTVPNVTPSNSDAADATWVGIGGVSTSDLIQAGTDVNVQSGQVIYTATDMCVGLFETGEQPAATGA